MPVQSISDILLRTHYCRVFLFASLLITLIYGIRNFSVLKDLKVFFWYLLLDFCLLCITIPIEPFNLLDDQSTNRFYGAINGLVSVTELVVYYIYLNPVKLLGKRYNLVLLSLITIALFVVISNISMRYPFDLSLAIDSYSLSAAIFLIILPIALLNLFTILKNDHLHSLNHESEFWITIGVLFYCALSSPYYYLRGSFQLNHYLQLIFDEVLFYTPFIINCICILIAFICRKQAKKS